MAQIYISALGLHSLAMGLLYISAPMLTVQPPDCVLLLGSVGYFGEPMLAFGGNGKNIPDWGTRIRKCRMYTECAHEQHRMVKVSVS